MFTRSQLSSMVSLIRDNPTMDRDSVYSFVSSPEEEVQLLTQSLVDLEYVTLNHYDDIAPWLRSLPTPQVSLMVDAVYSRYKDSVNVVELDDQIVQLDSGINNLLDKKAIVEKRKSDLELTGDPDDAEFAELLSVLSASFQGSSDVLSRTKLELEDQKELL